MDSAESFVEDAKKPVVKGLSLKGTYNVYWNEKPFMSFGADDGWKPFIRFNGASTINMPVAAPVLLMIITGLLQTIF